MAQPQLKEDRYYYYDDEYYDRRDEESIEQESYALRQIREAEQELRLREKKRAREVSKQRRNAAKNIAAVLFVFAVLSVVVSRYAAISVNDLENYKLKENIISVEEEIKALDLKITMQDDITQITDRAQQELGMGFPSGNQVIYLPIEKRVEVTEINEDEFVQEWSLQSFWAGIVDTVESWFE